MLVVVIDGLGGGIGSQLVAKLEEAALADVEIYGLGTNSAATEAMIRAGAVRGATGENAIKVMAAQADVIMGPVGIIIADAMMGEISAAIAAAVVGSQARKLLLPLAQPHVEFVGFEPQPIGGLIRTAVDRLIKICSQ